MGAVDVVFRDDRLTGTFDGAAVLLKIQGRRKNNRATGLINGQQVAVEWTVGGNQHNLNPVTELTGTVGAAAVGLTAKVQLTSYHALRHVDIAGSVAGQEVAVQVRSVEAPSAGPTVVEIDGTFGTAELTLCASMATDLGGARIEGLVAGIPVRLTAGRDGDGTIRVAGDYAGSPELLHLLVGSLLSFL